MDLSNYGRVSRLMPQKIPDADQAALRLTPYGDQTVTTLYNNLIPMADEGTYFYAANPTAGTGIVITATMVAYTAIAPAFMLQNLDVAGGKNIYPDFIKCTLMTLAGTTGGTTSSAVIEIDSVNRYTSGGTSFTPYNTNTNVPPSTTIARCYGGAIVATALQGTTRRITNTTTKSVTLSIYDTVIFDFGAVEKNISQGNLALATASLCMIPCPPVCLGPSGCLMVYLISLAETGTARYYEFSAGWIER